jgi:hypothetical protein
VSTDIPRLLIEARSALEEAGLAFAVIGGCARNAYAEPRATKDVDFVVEVDEHRHPQLVEGLARRGFACATKVADGTHPVPDLALYRDPGGRRVDLLFAHTELERMALARSERREPYAGVILDVVSPEDLLVYKLIADRPQDRADIAAVVATLAMAGRVIDWEYVERWCDVWDVRPRLDRLRAEGVTDR